PISASTYVMSGGTLKANNMELDGPFDGTLSRFIQTGGHVVVAGDLSLSGSTSSYTMLGGSLHARGFDMGYLYYPEPGTSEEATLSLLKKSAKIEISGYMFLGGGSHLNAVPGTAIHFTHIDTT